MMNKMGEGESGSKTWEEEMTLFSSKNDELLASCEEAILDEVLYEYNWRTIHRQNVRKLFQIVEVCVDVYRAMKKIFDFVIFFSILPKSLEN